MIASFDAISPAIQPGVLVASSAMVLGDVRLEEDVNIWYSAVLRGDVNSIEIGARTNLQEQVVVHVTSGTHATVVGHDVTVGHRAVLHGCSIGPHVLVGMGAVVLDGARVQSESVVAAGSVLPPGKVYPPGSLIMGSPGRVVRPTRPDEIAAIAESSKSYVALARKHRTTTDGWDAISG